MLQPSCAHKEAIHISIDRIQNGTKRSKRRKSKQRRQILVASCIVIGLLLLMIVGMIMLPSGTSEAALPIEIPASVFSQKPRIPKDTTISGILVGGLTEQKAIERVSEKVSHTIENQGMIVTYADTQFVLSPDRTGVHWDVETAVQQAMQGHSCNLEITANRQYIEQALRSFFADLGGIYSPAGFWVEGALPDLETQTGENQVLVLNPGSSGWVLDLYDMIDQIMDAYRTDSLQVTLPTTQERREAQPLDLENVFDRVSVAPINPDLDRITLDIIPGKVGYGFDLEKAKKMLEHASGGESVKIEMQYLEPALSEDDVWYQDILGYCKTEITDNENRNENLRLACSMLNEKILQPGETLSYNQTLGKRTREAGYKPAPAYSGVDLVDEIGGGICQVSSTLYLSSLFAELNIIERRNHGFPVSYIPLGLDATVNWGTTDLKIRNDYELPVKILAEVADGYVNVKIMGVEQREYYVKMEYRVDDHPSYAAAFRCRYDRQTDEQIFRNLDHTSIYLEEVWCWPGYAQSANDY